MIRQRVWDLPLRLFHWALAACVTASIATAKLGGAAMTWHLRLGTVIMALLLFRLLWGFLGGHWSLFRHWPLTPEQLRRDKVLWSGHSPSGALATVGLLGLLGLQVLTGLVADDEIATAGPWSAAVSSRVAGLATAYHQHWGQWLVMGMLALHLSAIAYYTGVRRLPLLAAMWHGDKSLEHAPLPNTDGRRLRIRALLLACGAGVIVWLVTT